jgi:hypothetical protein
MSITRTVFVLTFAVAAVSASAQKGGVDVNAVPNYGEVRLVSGFTPDPHVVSLVSGGNLNALNAGNGCRGFVTASPDVRLTYQAGSLPLIVSVASSSDTTLVVNAPDGTFHCDDDGGVNGLNPSIRFNRPLSGRYEIWVGSYRAGSNASARLHISEVRSQ